MREREAANGRQEGAASSLLSAMGSLETMQHSNYAELREYVRWLAPAEVVPTVGVDGLYGRYAPPRIAEGTETCG